MKTIIQISAFLIITINGFSQNRSDNKSLTQFSDLSTASLDSKIQFLMDREEITAIIKYYALSMDTKDWELQGNLFLNEYEAWNKKKNEFVTRTVANRLVGREKASKKFIWTQHIASIYSIEIDGDTAFVKSTLNARHQPKTENPDEFLMIGHYHYWLAKTDNGWKISKMKIINDKKRIYKLTNEDESVE